MLAHRDPNEIDPIVTRRVSHAKDARMYICNTFSRLEFKRIWLFQNYATSVFVLSEIAISLSYAHLKKTSRMSVYKFLRLKYIFGGFFSMLPFLFVSKSQEQGQ